MLVGMFLLICLLILIMYLFFFMIVVVSILVVMLWIWVVLGELFGVEVEWWGEVEDMFVCIFFEIG